jgi:isocitrate dehydrogenase
MKTSKRSGGEVFHDSGNKPRIAIAYGDGIGPEIMASTLAVLKAAGAELAYDEIKIGQDVYLRGVEAGIEPGAWDILRQNKVFLKSPITTPQGGGYKSLNVTVRKTLGLFANVRPCRAYTPYVESHFPTMDLVVIRENEEDLYAGIEHQQTNEVVQCLKLISRPGSEKVIRYAFEYARAYGRKKVTCMTKDNIMKLADGLFHRVFNEVAAEYPDIESNHFIIDIGAAMLADRPEMFDVIVTLNLYGDIISDITAQVAGSVGLGGSANIGDGFAMFEAIHGSAPDISGKDIANPSGLIHAACLMLVHVGQPKVAERIMNALLKTLEDGIHTGDIFSEQHTVEKVGTKAFTEAVIARLGQRPDQLKAVNMGEQVRPIEVKVRPTVAKSKRLLGVDVFLDWTGERRDPRELGQILESITGDQLMLKMITNRGLKVYPGENPETFCTDHWRCRFVARQTMHGMHRSQMAQPDVIYYDIISLLQRLMSAGLNFIKIENLYEIDGQRAYSLGQGE